MATITRFEDLNAWKEARALTRLIYRTSKKHPFARDFALRDQIRRACISITANIAEGFERDSSRTFRHFLKIAKGSSGEVRSLLYVALDESYIDENLFEDLYEQTSTLMRLIAGLIRYLEEADAEKD